MKKEVQPPQNRQKHNHVTPTILAPKRGETNGAFLVKALKVKRIDDTADHRERGVYRTEGAFRQFSQRTFASGDAARIVDGCKRARKKLLMVFNGPIFVHTPIIDRKFGASQEPKVESALTFC